MTYVYKFPPVGIAAYENTIDDPMSVSVGISGGARGSQTRANRTLYGVKVQGIGDGVGYVEALKQLLKGKLPLVQVKTMPAIWWNRALGRRGISGPEVTWTEGGDNVSWVSGGEPVYWTSESDIQATAGNDGFDFIDLTGLAAGQMIHIGEAVQGVNGVAYVLRPVTTNSEITRVHLTAPIASGVVTIGEKVTRIFRLMERPRAMQVTGAFHYDFSMIEAFESDFSDGVEVLDPWT